jgi:hypothetical protein
LEQGIERLTALLLLMTSLSHIAAPLAWARLFARLRESGELAGLGIAAIHAPLGVLILAFHPVWSWPGVVVTALGYALAAKSLLYLLVPRLAQRTIPGDPEAHAWRYRAAGLLMLPFATWIGFLALG